MLIRKQINCDDLLTFISTPVKKDIYLYVKHIIQKSRFFLIIGGNQGILTNIHHRIQTKKLYIIHHPDGITKIIKE